MTSSHQEALPVTHINLFGPINRLGMGIYFQNWAKELLPALANKGVGCGIIPRGPITPATDRLFACLRPALGRFNHNGNSISLWHAAEPWDFAGRRRALYTVWETTRLLQDESEAIQQVDCLFVPTHWHRQCLLDNDYEHPEVMVIPGGYDPAVFRPTPDFELSASRVQRLDPNELRMFSMGKLEKRKGIEVLVDALTLVKSSRPINVVACWANPFIPNWLGQARDLLERRGFVLVRHMDPGGQILYVAPNGNGVVLMAQRDLGQHEVVAGLIRTCHWGVFPSFAEGWDLPLIETMACGVPVIAQNYSGPSEYLHAGYIALDGKMVTARDGAAFRGDRGEWREVNTGSLVAALAHAASMAEDERVRWGRAAAASVSRFTWADAAATTVEHLTAIGWI
jgi:glycosyltransferase involved in cell wall biosynthesis